MIDEKKVLNQLSNLVDNDINFNDISHNINYDKYKKEKRVFNKKLLVIFSLALTVFIVILIIPKNRLNLDKYDGFVKEEIMNGNNSSGGGNMGPSPLPPMVDHIFIASSNEDSEYLFDNYIDRIYEVEFKKDLENDYYIGVYLNEGLANKIAKECDVIMDGVGASPVDYVNGSIVSWFYSSYNKGINRSLINWYILGNNLDEIYSNVNGKVCVGVYRIYNRTIIKEILSDTDLSIGDKIFRTLEFKNNGDEYLEAISKDEDYCLWYNSGFNIDSMETKYLYSYNKFDLVINKELDTISLYSYGGLSIEESSKNPYTYLKMFHEKTDALIVENNYKDRTFGKTARVTYHYSSYIEELKEFYDVVVKERKLYTGTYGYEYENTKVNIIFGENNTFSYSDLSGTYLGEYSIDGMYLYLKFDDGYSGYFIIKNGVIKYLSGRLPNYLYGNTIFYYNGTIE